ncbi:MAG: hypothetical protein ACRDOU_29645 [Streptosporangiaceae bacterium]
MRGPAVIPDPRDESQAQRDDRNLAELLQELRPTGVLIGICVGCAFGALWFAFPLTRRR